MITQEMVPGILFQELTRLRYQAVLAELAAHGLGDLGAPMVLVAIRREGREGEIDVQRKLSDILRISPATVAVSLKSLERAGYVEKRPHETDARRKRIALTPRGAQAVELCLQSFRRVDERMLQGLSETEVSQLRGYLTRMRENLCGRQGREHTVERTKPECSDD